MTENATVLLATAVAGGFTTAIAAELAGGCELDALAEELGLAVADEVGEVDGFTLVELETLELADELPLPLGLGLGVRVTGCDHPPYGATLESHRDFKSNCFRKETAFPVAVAPR